MDTSVTGERSFKGALHAPRSPRHAGNSRAAETKRGRNHCHVRMAPPALEFSRQLEKVSC